MLSKLFLRLSTKTLRPCGGQPPKRIPLGRWTFRVGYWTFANFLSVAAALALATLTGCVTPPPVAEPSGWMDGPERQPFILGVQYVASTGNAGCETVEVFIVNPTASPVTFTNAVLDGIRLPPLEEAAARQAAKGFRFDIGGRAVAPPPPAALDERAAWWQFYPSPTIPAGGSALFQVNFRNAAGKSRPYPLTLAADDGTVLDAAIPHYMPPARRITAAAWAPDGRTLNIQYTRGAAPTNVLINGTAPAGFRTLAAAGQGGPGAVAVPLGKPIAQGAAVLIELDFGAEGVRRAFLRASPGILLDASGVDHSKQLPKSVRQEYGLDDVSTVYVLPYDVVCDDTRAGRHGHSAPDAAVARLKAYRDDPARLSGVDFCTALYPSVWNIYAPLADAVVTKPYQLHWGPDPARFIEGEDELIARAVAAAAPRPAVWIPERFARNRHLEGEELKVLAWTALLRGIKGIRCNHWKNSADKPFLNCPGTGEALKALNADIRRVRAVLSPLLPHAARHIREQRLTLYEGWCGDAGVLLLARNMRYATDEEPDDSGRSPRFHVDVSEDVPLAFTPPPWLKPGPPVDLLTGERLPTAEGARGALTITLPSLASHRLVWIPNADPNRLQKLAP